ncbi:hypothetical protein DN752_18010 [Echinicola strongylocentroti]|uniref:Uncharacterized protein n=1 Tax=Echinicola strongylocentroti TaxID=1795355 RepID=A0A2Z4IMQ3_9BACT|nr:hypothetical protein [Echinicola strongylocentroti]AWW31876.1 hypothetical protein DN752_18010 [Echinicola strongylocentroti]
MSTRNMDTLIAQILNTPPYQMPPVVFTGGIYQLDLSYRGESLNITKTRLYDCMDSYLDFVIRVNNKTRFRRGDFDKLPHKYGEEIRTPYRQPSRVTHTG